MAVIAQMKAKCANQSILLEFEDTSDDLGYGPRLLNLLLDALGFYIINIGCSKYSGDMHQILKDLYHDLLQTVEKVQRILFGTALFIFIDGFNILFESFLCDGEPHQAGRSSSHIGVFDQIVHFVQKLKTELGADINVTFFFSPIAVTNYQKVRSFKSILS